MTPEQIKKHAVDFFRWWYQKPGANTEQGYDDYVAAHPLPISALSQSAIPTAPGSGEPVATVATNDPGNDLSEAFSNDDWCRLLALPVGAKLYTHPAPLPVQVEPAFFIRYDESLGAWNRPSKWDRVEYEALRMVGHKVMALYTHPAANVSALPGGFVAVPEVALQKFQAASRSPNPRAVAILLEEGMAALATTEPGSKGEAL